MHSEFIQVHPRILGCKLWRAAVRLCHWILKSDTCAVEQSTAFHDHRLSPFPMQNPNSKSVLAIKTLFVHVFSKFLQVLLGQTEIKILT